VSATVESFTVNEENCASVETCRWYVKAVGTAVHVRSNGVGRFTVPCGGYVRVGTEGSETAVRKFRIVEKLPIPALFFARTRQ
jgi:hypothetical protein